MQNLTKTQKKRKSFKVKSGRLQWRFSKRYESLRAELAEVFRLSAATRKREHEIGRASCRERVCLYV